MKASLKKAIATAQKVCKTLENINRIDGEEVLIFAANGHNPLRFSTQQLREIIEAVGLKRKPPAPKDIKIEPLDPHNWSNVYITFDEECVVLKGESFGEPDVYKMLLISNDQWKKLQRLKQ